jgi:hypothetical protein
MNSVLLHPPTTNSAQCAALIAPYSVLPIACNCVDGASNFFYPTPIPTLRRITPPGPVGGNKRSALRRKQSPDFGYRRPAPIRFGDFNRRFRMDSVLYHLPTTNSAQCTLLIAPYSVSPIACNCVDGASNSFYATPIAMLRRITPPGPVGRNKRSALRRKQSPVSGQRRSAPIRFGDVNCRLRMNSVLLHSPTTNSAQCALLIAPYFF